MTIPKFLTEMSEQMNAQNNRSTSNPIWQVRCKRMRITADNYSDFWQIVDDNNECRVVTSCLKEDVNKDILEYFKDIGELEFIHKYADWTEEFNTSAEKEEYFVDSFDHECGELPENLRVIWLEEYEEIIKSAFFTEMDALSFITRRQHKYPKLYTYVDSMCECPQIIQLQEWIKSLTPPTKQGDTK